MNGSPNSLYTLPTNLPDFTPSFNAATTNPSIYTTTYWYMIDILTVKGYTTSKYAYPSGYIPD